MIVRSTLEELEAAVSVSQDQLDWKNPSIQVLGDGVYSVAGSKGAYRVRCWQTHQNRFAVECFCPAGQHGRACYHALKGMLRHIEIQKERKQL